MRRKIHIKKLDKFLLKSFLPLFLLTFAICLFLVLMQFLWKYVDDFVGKGLGLVVIGEMFGYAALNFVPMALPLSILLASLMLYGNMGERLELLAIKSAGISLIKSMRALIVLIILICIGAFFYQNNVIPKTQTKFYSLLISIRQKSPELDIPEGVFYKEISGYNIYVKKKNRDTGMMYDVAIYDIASGFQNMAVIICDSADMKMAEDKLSLVFNMYHGQSFQNFTQGTDRGVYSGEFIPYARESFQTKTLVISYDDNFNRMDENVIQDNESSSYVSKNIRQLQKSIDSLESVVDSINVADRKLMKEYAYLNFRNSYSASEKEKIIAEVSRDTLKLHVDSLLNAKDLQTQAMILDRAYAKAENNANDQLFRSMNKTSKQNTINRSWIEWHRKFTLSFACLIFFFIGAPLGSIVRKGGLGVPIVISVILFIIYYILDNVGYKMARDGVWIHWQGMWFSSLILLPLGIFLTYKAMNDSAIMNMDTYLNFFKKVFFIREKRNYTIKEIVIEETDFRNILSPLNDLSGNINAHLKKYSRLNYRTFFTNPAYEQSLSAIKNTTDNILNTLANSQNCEVIKEINEYPVLIKYVKPFNVNSVLAKYFMYLFPFGILLKLLSILFEKRINNDLKRILELNEKLTETIKSLYNKQQ